MLRVVTYFYIRLSFLLVRNAKVTNVEEHLKLAISRFIKSCERLNYKSERERKKRQIRVGAVNRESSEKTIFITVLTLRNQLYKKT